MYQSHWGLRESPFRNCANPNFYYQSPTHEEALARLHFLVEQRRRLGLLMGPDGSGKSFLLEIFAEQLRRSGRPTAKVNLLAIEPGEMLWLLAVQLGLNPDPTNSLAVLWRLVTDRLLEYRIQQIETVILLDDADQASRQVLTHVVRLAQCDPSPESRLTLVLAGQQEQMGRIGDRLLALADLRIDIEPWAQADTDNYLKASLAQAGCARRCLPSLPWFVCKSFRTAYRVGSISWPTWLLAGAGQALQQIGPEVVETAYHELGVTLV